MTLYIITAFLIGGFVGILGMSLLAAGPKSLLHRDNRILRFRLNFLEREGHQKRQKPVHDPRKKVEKLVH